MEKSKPEGYSLNELQSLANLASSQYLDLESAENELAAWIRNANRGPQASANPSNEFTPAPPPSTPTWELPLHPQPQQTHQSLTMYDQPESQYTYDHPQTQFYYPPPSTDSHSPVQSYYQGHSHTYPPILPEPPNDTNSSHSNAYAYPSQHSSPSGALSPSSSSTDPELKRIRNTAASARFRAKKKRREASLERNSKEKREALERLEKRIRELEAENQFLKGLIFDKEKLEGVKSELERAREMKRDLEMDAGEGQRDDGVGTEE